MSSSSRLPPLPASASATMTPVPILKPSLASGRKVSSGGGGSSARKRRHTPSAAAVGFTEEVATVIKTKHARDDFEEEEEGGGAGMDEDEELAVESDTDVGSSSGNDLDGSFSFDYHSEEDGGDRERRGGQAAGEGTGAEEAAVSGVGAKVRRLNLSDGDGDGIGGASGKSMDVKRAIQIARSSIEAEEREKALASRSVGGRFSPARKQPQARGVSGGSFSATKCTKSPGPGAVKSLYMPSSARRQRGEGRVGDDAAERGRRSPVASLFGSPPRGDSSAMADEESPSRNSGNDRGMLICPPSTARKSRGGVSRLFADAGDSSPTIDFGGRAAKAEKRGDNVEEEDVSPRDVVEFPFFGGSPSNSGKKKQADISADARQYSGENFEAAPRPRSPPQCPPSTMKHRPPRSMFELDAGSTKELMARSPPRGLRSHGRASSFMQMFSQETVTSTDGGDVGRGRGAGSGDEDGSVGGFLLHRMHSRQDSVASALGAELTVSSPRRPMRKNHHQRFTPASPVGGTGGSGGGIDSSFSRFVSDFEVVGTLGDGSFGSVYSVRNRTDKRMYAIKAAKREARGRSDRDRMMQEVYALASLSDKACVNSMHIVRYYQAWMEGNRLYIQTELCDSTLLQEMKEGALVDSKRRFKLLREMLLALDLVHKSGMIHLDIKPENILIKDGQYKLGDFGLVSKIESHDDVEEGDSRYMSMELLSGEMDDLTKYFFIQPIWPEQSDVFSLGATMYEICLGRSQPLPENGQEWQDIRHGILLPMPNTAFDMQMIIREMMSPEWRSRPSAEELLKKRQLLSDEQRQLIVERNKANAANMALDAQMQRFKQLSPQKGRKFLRSNTIC